MYAFTLGLVISIYFLLDHDEIIKKTTIYSLYFLGLVVFTLIVNILQQYLFAYMGECLTKEVREQMLLKILIIKVGWMNSKSVVCSRLTKDANVVCFYCYLYFAPISYAFWHAIYALILIYLYLLYKDQTITLTRIPKLVVDPQHLLEFWPIFFMECMYKILTKVLSNRIKRVLGGVIYQRHSLFLEWRYLLHSTFVANEVVQEAKR